MQGQPFGSVDSNVPPVAVGDVCEDDSSPHDMLASACISSTQTALQNQGAMRERCAIVAAARVHSYRCPTSRVWGEVSCRARLFTPEVASRLRDALDREERTTRENTEAAVDRGAAASLGRAILL